METPDFIAALLRPDAYPHPCDQIRMVETHISWVFLTGSFAYKVKKPVQFGFVDFSTAQKRSHFCEEELRCNRAFTPELYLGLATINRDDEGRFHVNGAGPALESAVKMRQFPAAQQLDVLLAAGGLETADMYRFGQELADQHAQLPASRYKRDDEEMRVLQPIVQNFEVLGPLCAGSANEKLINELEQASRASYAKLRPRFAQRGRDGFTRECHGDLHLTNLVMLDGRVRAFDCLEFNPNLRWIDTASDISFLLMDCAIRDREDLGYAFLDGYLTRSVDYEGAALAGFYQVYRSIVRAKVAGLGIDERCDAGRRQALQERITRHLSWAGQKIRAQPGALLLMCGLSGSGKSWLAQRLVTQLPAVRIRSDALRKRLAGLETGARSHSPLDAGIYSREQNLAVYAQLLDSARALLEAGESVIVDATFLGRHQRDRFAFMAGQCQSDCTIVHCTADTETLERRLTTRRLKGASVSEADICVLHRQRSRFDEPAPEENCITVNTNQVSIVQIAAQLRSARH